LDEKNRIISPWWPKQPAIYDIRKTYLENAEDGPCFSSEIPQRTQPNKKDWIDFLGFKIASPIGIPAGPLLNAKWIGLAADLGYDVLLYKTIRSHEHPSHPLPNVVPIQADGPLIPTHLPDFVRQVEKPSPFIEHLSITNSFGNPSRSQGYLRHDIPLAYAKLNEGQVMIVSVFGTSREGVDMMDDFANTARFAKECGAQIIEANYSCPNITKEEGSLYASPEAVYKLSLELKKAIGDLPLIIKVGTFLDPSLMRECFIAAARAGVQAICGINTISMKVLNNLRQPALGPHRETCGICGGAIRQAALDFIRQSREIIDKEKLDMQLLATGGVTLPHHFQEFLDAGADITMTATGMMWDPYLAMRFHRKKEEYNHATQTTHFSTL